MQGRGGVGGVGGGGSQKVSIAVVSSHGAVCWGKLGTAVEKKQCSSDVASATEEEGSSHEWTAAAGAWGGLEKGAEPCAGRAWGLGRASGSACRGSAGASGQTLVYPVWLFLHWLLQNIRKKPLEHWKQAHLYAGYYFPHIWPIKSPWILGGL